mmetsp:Transcript_15160/g.33164  ORF Transcript_15160/g.33164 Transcript_15160/m.33164 type:complete len:225 (+) Transcript_15160:1448-2122(+)
MRHESRQRNKMLLLLMMTVMLPISKLIFYSYNSRQIKDSLKNSERITFYYYHNEATNSAWAFNPAQIDRQEEHQFKTEACSHRGRKIPSIDSQKFRQSGVETALVGMLVLPSARQAPPTPLIQHRACCSKCFSRRKTIRLGLRPRRRPQIVQRQKWTQRFSLLPTNVTKIECMPLEKFQISFILKLCCSHCRPRRCVGSTCEERTTLVAFGFSSFPASPSSSSR